MIVNTKKILTGVSALYQQNIISFSPTKKHYEMPFGTNTSNLSKKYKISTQIISTFNIGVLEIDDILMYCPERLFIELNKYPMESTIKKEAIRNLEKIINPELVKKYYKKLKKKRRGLDKELIENFLEKNLMNIEELISKKNSDVKSIIREYLMALVSKDNVPVSLIKGGSSVELYLDVNRSTADVDTHLDKKDIVLLLNKLKNKDNVIYFDIKDQNNLNKQIEKKKMVVKINLIPRTRKISIKEKIYNIEIPISFNTTYSNDDIKEIINDYKITKHKLRRLKNVSVMIFSKEMLLAEKYQALISKPKISQRTKDLLDLYMIYDESIDFNKFKKWFFRKWKYQRYPKNEKESILCVKNNKDKELLKIKDNFEDAKNMYDYDVKFEDCIKVYELLHKEIIKENN